MDPVNQKERLAHVQAARSSLKTEFTWICDNMENDLKHALGDRPNSEFVIDPEGRVVIKRSWSDPKQLREDLEKLVGKSETTTKVADLGFEVKPRPEQAARGVVPRLELTEGMTALKSELISSSEGEQYYVKLRAEANERLLKTGNGKLYLAFHVDPIYQVHWNNDSMQLEYEMQLPSGVKANQPSGKGPQVDVSADADPREFLIDITSGEPSRQPIEVTARFMICDDAETFCIPVTEVFQVYLVEDPELGWRSASRRRGNRLGAGNMAERMKQRDANGDGKISKDELPERMRERFDRMDTNKDGFIDESEMQAMSRRGRRRGRDR